MVLFLALSAPAATLLLLGMVDISLLRRVPWYRQAAAGFLWFFPVAGLSFAVTNFRRPSFDPSALFWTAFWLDYAAWVIVLLLGCTLVFRSMREWDAPAMHIGHLVFLGVAFTLLGIVEVIQVRSYVSLYVAFLRPALRIALLVVVPVVVSAAQLLHRGLFAVPLLIVGPALSAGVAMLSESNRGVAASILTLILVMGAFASLWWFLPWDRRPVKLRRL